MSIVYIRLQTKDIYDIETRVEEIKEIKEWLDELVEWKEEKYKVKIHSMGTRVVVWFDEQEHAVMCKLRWSA